MRNRITQMLVATAVLTAGLTTGAAAQGWYRTQAGGTTILSPFKPHVYIAGSSDPLQSIWMNQPSAGSILIVPYYGGYFESLGKGFGYGWNHGYGWNPGYGWNGGLNSPVNGWPYSGWPRRR